MKNDMVSSRIPVEYISVFSFHRCMKGCRDSVVGIATCYRLDDRGVGAQVPVGVRIFTFPNRPDRLWGPPTSYPTGTRGSLPRGKAAGA
jgi:hypothetical protein